MIAARIAAFALQSTVSSTNKSCATLPRVFVSICIPDDKFAILLRVFVSVCIPIVKFAILPFVFISVCIPDDKFAILTHVFIFVVSRMTNSPSCPVSLSLMRPG